MKLPKPIKIWWCPCLEKRGETRFEREDILDLKNECPTCDPKVQRQVLLKIEEIKK